MRAVADQHKHAIRLLVEARLPPGSHGSSSLLGDYGIDPETFDATTALGAFSRQLNRKEAAERFEAAVMLAWMLDRRAVSPLLRALLDPDWDVRLVAAGGLVELSPVPIWAVEPLGRAASDADSAVRVSAMEGLGCSECPDALEPLLIGLGDGSRNVRLAAAEGLERLSELTITSPAVRAVLESRMRDEQDPFVGSRMASALGSDRSEDRAAPTLAPDAKLGTARLSARPHEVIGDRH